MKSYRTLIFLCIFLFCVVLFGIFQQEFNENEEKEINMSISGDTITIKEKKDNNITTTFINQKTNYTIKYNQDITFYDLDLQERYLLSGNICKEYSNLEKVNIKYIQGKKHYIINGKLIQEETLFNNCLNFNIG